MFFKSVVVAVVLSAWFSVGASSAGGIALSTPERTAFLRGEESAVLEISISNGTGKEMRNVRASFEQYGAHGRVGTCVREIPVIKAGGCSRVGVPVETRIAPGRYVIKAGVSAASADGDLSSTAELRYGIGPRSDDKMSTVMWGYRAPSSTIASYGFTHGYYYSKCVREPVTSAFDRKPIMDVFDNALVDGLGIFRVLRPIYYPECGDTNRYYRLDRRGKPRRIPQPEVSNPELVERFRLISRQDAGIYGKHPAFKGVLPYTEQRDRSYPSFNTEHLRYKAETGHDVPADVHGKTYKLTLAEKRFPDGIVPDDDDVYRYYSWFFRGGDGWPGFISAGADTFRQTVGRGDFMSFYDPAVRTAPIWGSGGSVDMLNQWCYAVPEPMNVAGPCEEVLAMAAGRPGQRSAIMTQLICYRSQMAPTNVVPATLPEWARKFPVAAFPSVPPDVLQEATWSMMAKPVEMILFHGWGTVFDTGERRRYCFTNPQTAERLKHLLKNVIAPLGPVLKRLKRDDPKVAVFESFTTCAMGGPASWGWKAPSITMMQRARLDPKVVYEDTLRRDGFGGIRVLYAPQCRFLTPSIIEKIRSFQRDGGILVADGELVKALTPDVTIPVVSFDPPPDADFTEEVDAAERAKPAWMKTRDATVRTKRVMHEVAETVRGALAGRGYLPASDSSSADIVVYNRRWKDVPYLFAVNDRRGFGDYVGQWGLVMEKGLPNSGWVSVHDSSGRIKAVYELSRGEKCDIVREGTKVKVNVSFDTNDGRMLVFLPFPVARVDLSAPDAVRKGARFTVSMSVLGASGERVPGLLPAEIRLYAASGREVDGSGYFCSVDGLAKAEFLVDVDAVPGIYRVVCRDRASGLVTEKKIEVK